MDKMIRLGAGVIVLILLIWLIARPDDSIPPGSARLKFTDGTIVTAGLARTVEEMTQGLSGRESLAETEGLLFIYTSDEQPSFWMKDMKFSIDILWIHGETVVGFEENLQPEEPAKTLYTPEKLVNRVLEVPSGFVYAHQIKAGDTLDIDVSSK